MNVSTSNTTSFIPGETSNRTIEKLTQLNGNLNLTTYSQNHSNQWILLNLPTWRFNAQIAKHLPMPLINFVLIAVKKKQPYSPKYGISSMTLLAHLSISNLSFLLPEEIFLYLENWQKTSFWAFGKGIILLFACCSLPH